MYLFFKIMIGCGKKLGFNLLLFAILIGCSSKQEQDFIWCYNPHGCSLNSLSLQDKICKHLQVNHSVLVVLPEFGMSNFRQSIIREELERKVPCISETDLNVVFSNNQYKALAQAYDVFFPSSFLLAREQADYAVVEQFK